MLLTIVIKYGKLTSNYNLFEVRILNNKLFLNRIIRNVEIISIISLFCVRFFIFGKQCVVLSRR